MPTAAVSVSFHSCRHNSTGASWCPCSKSDIGRAAILVQCDLLNGHACRAPAGSGAVAAPQAVLSRSFCRQAASSKRRSRRRLPVTAERRRRRRRGRQAPRSAAAPGGTATTDMRSTIRRQLPQPTAGQMQRRRQRHVQRAAVRRTAATWKSQCRWQEQGRIQRQRVTPTLPERCGRVPAGSRKQRKSCSRRSARSRACRASSASRRVASSGVWRQRRQQRQRQRQGQHRRRSSPSPSALSCPRAPARALRVRLFFLPPYALITSVTPARVELPCSIRLALLQCLETAARAAELPVRRTAPSSRVSSIPLCLHQCVHHRSCRRYHSA